MLFRSTANVDGRDYNGGKGYVVEFGGTVNSLSPDPATSNGLTVTTISPVDSATVVGKTAFNYRIAPERYSSSGIERVGMTIRDSNGAKLQWNLYSCPSISYSYCRRPEPGLTIPERDLTFGTAVADISWTKPNLTDSLVLDVTGWANGKYT